MRWYFWFWERGNDFWCWIGDHDIYPGKRKCRWCGYEAQVSEQ